MGDKQVEWDRNRDATYLAHKAKMKADVDKERLRSQANRNKKKAEKLAAAANLLQLNIPHVPLPVHGHQLFP